MIQNALLSLLTICWTNCWPCVIIVSRKGDVCADEGPKIKKKRKVMYLLEKVEVLYVRWTMEWVLLWSDAIMVAKNWQLVSSKKNKAWSEEALGQMLHQVWRFLVTVTSVSKRWKGLVWGVEGVVIAVREKAIFFFTVSMQCDYAERCQVPC
jgi:hypothetical protein